MGRKKSTQVTRSRATRRNKTIIDDDLTINNDTISSPHKIKATSKRPSNDFNTDPNDSGNDEVYLKKHKTDNNYTNENEDDIESQDQQSPLNNQSNASLPSSNNSSSKKYAKTGGNNYTLMLTEGEDDHELQNHHPQRSPLYDQSNTLSPSNNNSTSKKYAKAGGNNYITLTENEDDHEPRNHHPQQSPSPSSNNDPSPNKANNNYITLTEDEDDRESQDHNLRLNNQPNISLSNKKVDRESNISSPLNSSPFLNNNSLQFLMNNGNTTPTFSASDPQHTPLINQQSNNNIMTILATFAQMITAASLTITQPNALNNAPSDIIPSRSSNTTLSTPSNTTPSNTTPSNTMIASIAPANQLANLFIDECKTLFLRIRKPTPELILALARNCANHLGVTLNASDAKNKGRGWFSTWRTRLYDECLEISFDFIDRYGCTASKLPNETQLRKFISKDDVINVFEPQLRKVKRDELVTNHNSWRLLKDYIADVVLLMINHYTIINVTHTQYKAATVTTNDRTAW
ncbi:unnamed protein product [Rhizophagus irregularis]|nr:unnamed protein product [Rhizophagus irregularis]